jgi:uncharacterized protein YjiS (DUF1127 family)
MDKAMALAFEPTPRTGGFRAARDWLRDARSALAHPVPRISGMSDRELRDIGLRPRSLTSTVYREIGKTGLVDFGWRLGR